MKKVQVSGCKSFRFQDAKCYGFRMRKVKVSGRKYLSKKDLNS
jgi:hypothetical protein